MNNEFEKGLLKYIDVDFLNFIQSFEIGLAGLGGLGSNILNSLVRVGFNNFTICDFDKVENSNLNRQYYNIDDLGINKTEAIIKNMKKINNNITFNAKILKLNKDNMEEVFKYSDIIFEAFDNPKCKKELFEIFSHQKEKIVIFGSGMAGFNITENKIKIQKLRENIFIVGDMTTNVDKENPPFAPKVIAVASIMAGIALETLHKKYKKTN